MPIGLIKLIQINLKKVRDQENKNEEDDILMFS